MKNTVFMAVLLCLISVLPAAVQNGKMNMRKHRKAPGWKRRKVPGMKGKIPHQKQKEKALCRKINGLRRTQRFQR